jgi:hypothetical protein
MRRFARDVKAKSALGFRRGLSTKWMGIVDENLVDAKMKMEKDGPPLDF